VDLNADGDSEIIVPSLVSVSNGMAVQWSEIAILDGRHLFDPPLVFEANEFGPFGSFTTSGLSGPCRVFIASWLNGDDRVRGSGLYLVGEWFLYDRGELVPDITRPVLARRYLSAFESERGQDMQADNLTIPFKWFHDRNTEALNFFPIASTAPEGVKDGTLKRIAFGRLVIDQAGNEIELTPDPWWPDNRLDDSTSYVQIIDSVTGRAYPLGYQPRAAPTLVNRRVSILIYREWKNAPIIRYVRIDK